MNIVARLKNLFLDRNNDMDVGPYFYEQLRNHGYDPASLNPTTLEHVKNDLLDRLKPYEGSPYTSSTNINMQQYIDYYIEHAIQLGLFEGSRI